MAGVNRAIPKMWEMVAKSDRSERRPCIFISHIKIDQGPAKDIGEFIRNDGDLDIYLDVYDSDLQKAVEDQDPLGITRFVERGLAKSDSLLCLVSENTISSWWVPYEIGFAKNAAKGIATLLLKDAVTLPAYLEIGRVLVDFIDLSSYMHTIGASRMQKVSKTTTSGSTTSSGLGKHLVLLRHKKDLKIVRD
ncbi:MAG: TIR domain-containing protein [Syntrophobacteraceae bacterium]|jgi:hypothetical protein